MPSLYAGTRTAKLLKVGSGYLDDTVAYNLIAHSERIAPASSGGEAIFTLLYITTRHFADSVSFTVTPIIDNVALAAQTIALVGATTTTGIRQTHELALYIPYVRNTVEILRTAPRGTWIELLVTTTYSGAGAAKQIIELAEFEYEVVRETQQGEAR